MPETPDGTGSVSWKLFNDMYESQHDLFRKLRFFVEAGKLDHNETIALESIAEVLDRKERELEKLRRSGLQEWGGGPGSTGPDRPAQRALISGADGNMNTLPVLFEDADANRSLWSRIKSRMRGG